MHKLVPTLAIALLLAGCAMEPPPEERSGSSGQDPSLGDTPCLLGRWYLDVPDYEAQSAAFMRGLGLPLDSYAMSGTQILDINDEPLITISTDLTIDAVFYGQPRERRGRLGRIRRVDLALRRPDPAQHRGLGMDGRSL